MIDSGFRPGKPGAGDDHAVYEFTRKHAWLCLPTKGHDRQPTPIRAAQIEVTAKGQRAPRSQTLWHLDSDFFKSQVHSRLRIEHGRPGAFYLPEDASDDYCRQLVSEWRTISPDNARAHWVVRNRTTIYSMRKRLRRQRPTCSVFILSQRACFEKPPCHRLLRSKPQTTLPLRKPASAPASPGWLRERTGSHGTGRDCRAADTCRWSWWQGCAASPSCRVHARQPPCGAGELAISAA
jgi:hypothetical protein